MVTNKKISLSKDKHNFYYHLAFYKSIYMCVHKQFQNKSARLLFRTPLLLLLSSLKHSQVKEKTAIQEINAKCIRIQEERQAQD